MTYLFRYSLSFLIIILINAKKKDKHSIKHKRDLSDLTDDPLLRSIFKSDIQEKRKDRSLTTEDEKEAERNEQQELLKNMLSTAKDLFRRDTAPYDGALNSSLSLPDSYYASLSNPIIGTQIPLPSNAKLSPLYNQENSMDSSAVVPKLFAANYLPLASQMMNPALSVSDSNGEVKRDSIAQPSSSQSASALHLRKYPPAKGLRGAVPHDPEYGETVESIERAQKAMIPQYSQMDPMAQMPQMMLPFAPVSQSMYSQAVFKKDSIPGPPAPEGAPTNVDDTPKISDPVPVDIAPKPSEAGSVDPAQQVADPNVVSVAPKPGTPSAVETTPMDKKSDVNDVAPQVQNLDAVYTRPIITDAYARSGVNVADEDCADQYTTCEDFAKNKYCTKYYNLMKIQCRKSCGFCDPYSKTRYQSNATQALVEVPANKSIEKKDVAAPAVTAPVSTSANVTTPAAEAGKKVVQASKNDTKATKKSTTAKAPKPAETHKKSSETSKKKGESTKKPAVSAKKSSKKSPEASKKSTETSKKTASKKSAETSKKHPTEAVSKNKPDTKATSKKSKEEKHKEKEVKKEEKEDGDKKSKLADMESGSTNEDMVDSGSGDFGSGDLGSGSGSGSGDEEHASLPTAVVKPVAVKTIEKEVKPAKKSPAKRSKIIKPDKVLPTKAAKSNLGEFTFPDKKTVVSTARLTLDENNENDESGSGSGSGEEPEPEEKVIKAKKAQVKKPKTGGKATAKKSTSHLKAPVAPKHAKKSKLTIKVKKSKKSEKTIKKSKVPKPQKEKHILMKVKKTEVPERPNLDRPRNLDRSRKLTSYPKIDLKLIASALAHYEEAALELAGEYPKPPPATNEVARSTIPRPPEREPSPVAAAPAPAPAAVVSKETITQRTIIPHPHPYEMPAPLPFENKKELIIDPLDKYKQNLQIAKLLTDDRSGRSSIPKYLKLTKDVKKGGSEEESNEYAADSLPSIQKRFNILGIEPTLIDYYAETGKINPFAQKHKKKDRNVRKSNIASGDPYEYLRNMPAGASMLPIDDPKARSNIPSDHSYPVFLMKVSPGERKYVDEPPMRRGEIRHLNAEGVRIDDKTETGGLPKDLVQKLKGNSPAPAAHSADKKKESKPAKKAQAPKVPPAVNAPSFTYASAGIPMYANPFLPNAEQAMAMMSVAANLQNNLLRAENILPQAKTTVPNSPASKPAAPVVRKPASAKVNVPRPASRPLSPPMSPAAMKAMEKSAISNGLQYAQNQMKINELNNLIARSRAQLNAPGVARSQGIRIPNAARNGVRAPAYDIAKATSPHLNPGLAGETQVNELNSLKNRMVSAFFPMKKDGVGAEGSGEAAKG